MCSTLVHVPIGILLLWRVGPPSISTTAFFLEATGLLCSGLSASERTNPVVVVGAGGSSLCFPALGLKPISSPITTTRKASSCLRPSKLLVQPTQAAVDLEGNGPDAQRTLAATTTDFLPLQPRPRDQSTCQDCQACQACSPSKPARLPSSRTRPDYELDPTRLNSTLPPDPALGSQLAHANLVCRRATSSASSVLHPAGPAQ